MRIAAFLIAAACAACAPAPPAHGPVSRPTLAAASFSDDILDQHNRERSATRAPPLQWDQVLASAAGAYARELAAIGDLRHSPRQLRPGQGENLWMGTRGAFAPRMMVANWASEKSMFRPGIFPNVSSTGNWADVGHYTQMIWPGTTRLGCGIASSGRSDFLVCRYAPAGNVDGRPVP